jgi:hypothetical protein
MALLTTPAGKELITVGGGIFYLAPWDGSTPPSEGDYIDVGEVSDLVLINDIQDIEIYSFRQAVKQLIDVRTKLVGYSFTAKLLEHSIVNWSIATKSKIVGNTLLALEEPNKYHAARFVANDGSEWEGHIFDFWIAKVRSDGNTNLIDLEKPKELPIKGFGLRDDTRDGVTSSQFYDVTFVDITV